MKRKKTAVALAALLTLAALTGCGGENRKELKNTFGNVSNGIYVYRNFSVEDCQLYDFAQDYYDANEFRGYLQEELDEYNESHDYRTPETMVPATDKEGATIETVGPYAEEAVAIRQCEKKDGKLYQRLLYASTEDYILFNEEEVTKRGGTALQAGKLTDADRSVLSETYTAPDATAFDVNAAVTGKEAALYSYVICNFEAYVYVDGEIVGYSNGGSYDAESNFVKVSAGTTAIVIFRSLQ